MTMKDGSSAFRLIDSTTFFAEHYPAVSGELAVFAQHVMQSARSPGDIETRAGLMSGAEHILREIYAVCSIPAPPARNSRATAFIADVGDLVDTLDRSDDGTAQLCARDLQIHVAYVRDKIIDHDGPLDEQEAIYFRDFAVTVVVIACNVIFSRFTWESADPRRTTTFFDAATAEAAMSQRARSVIEASATQLEGWCSSAKAAMLFALVREYQPITAVEIGIYGGRSIVPIALALQENRAGTVTGIETWTTAGSTKFRTNIANDFHWAITDYTAIKRSFFRFVLENELLDVIRVVEASSDRASSLIDTMDFIHIDGGHSTFGAALDIVTYVSKVRTGGIVVFDDIDWPTTGPAVEILRDSCQLLHVVPSFGEATVPGCAAFRKL